MLITGAPGTGKTTLIKQKKDIELLILTPINRDALYLSVLQNKIGTYRLQAD